MTDVVATLTQIPIFRTLGKNGAAELLRDVEVKRFEAGARIVQKGDPGDAMFVVLDGQISIPIFDDDGHERMTAHLARGDFFGEMALLTGEPRTADVWSKSATSCAVLRKPVVDAVVKKSPRVARFLTEIVGRRLLESGSLKQVGKYKIVGELGRGGGAIVYEGYHATLGRPVAVKMLSHDLVYEADFAQLFQQEARLIAELRHENIVTVFDTEAAYATFFIVMDRLDGTELKRVIEEGESSPEEVRHVVRQTARALLYAHRKGVVHRDVKPSNIFVEDKGTIKLMDFGIAGPPVPDGHADVAAGVMGTPGYIAPEVLEGKAFDGKADIYALGVVAYEMATGGSAWADVAKVEVLKRQLQTERLVLPDEIAARDPVLAAFVARATSRDPAARFPTCLSVLEHLDIGERASGEGADGIALTVTFEPRARPAVEALVVELREKLAQLSSTKVAVADLKR